MAQSSAGLAIQTDILHQQIIRQCGKDTGWLLAVNEIVKRARNNDVASDNLLIFKLFWQIIVANISA